MLTNKQRRIAKNLLKVRPKTIPGTRVVVDDIERKEWYDKVADSMTENGVSDSADVQKFCDLAGVPE